MAKSEGKRNTGADDLSEFNNVSKKMRKDFQTFKIGSKISDEDLIKIAANCIQRFWRRSCKNSLHALVTIMLDQEIETTHLKSIRFVPF